MSVAQVFWFYCPHFVCRTALSLVRVHLERKRYSLCMCGRHSELESWMNRNDSSSQVKILDTEEASILNHFLKCFLWKTYRMIEVSHNIFYNSFSYNTENGLFHFLLKYNIVILVLNLGTDKVSVWHSQRKTMKS